MQDHLTQGHPYNGDACVKMLGYSLRAIDLDVSSCTSTSPLAQNSTSQTETHDKYNAPHSDASQATPNQKSPAKRNFTTLCYCQGLPYHTWKEAARTIEPAMITRPLSSSPHFLPNLSESPVCQDQWIVCTAIRHMDLQPANSEPPTDPR